MTPNAEGRYRNVAWMRTHAANHATNVGMKMMKTIALRISSLQIPQTRRQHAAIGSATDVKFTIQAEDTHSGDFRLPEKGASMKLKSS